MSAAQNVSQARDRSLDAVRAAAGTSRHLALALPLIAGLLLPVQAYLLAHIIDQAVRFSAPIDALSAPLITLLALLVGRAALNGLGEHYAAGAAETAKASLRRRLVETMLMRGPVWSRAQSSGQVSSFVIDQVEAMDGYFGRYMPALIQSAVLPIAFAALVLPLDWVVGVLFVFTVPLIPLFMALAGWGAEAASQRQAAELSRLNGYFADRLRGIVTLKLFGREAAEIAGVATASAQLRQRTLSVLRIAFLSSAVLEFFAALGVAGVALYTGLSLLGLVNLRFVPLSLETGLFCLLMAPEVYQPIRTLAAHHHDRAAARAAYEQIRLGFGEIRAAAVALADQPAPAPLSAIALDIRALTVASPGGEPILDQLDLALRPGEHVVISGESGAGKSTLLEVISGLRPYEGEVRVNGRNLSEIAPADWRRSLAVFTQRNTLFAGTIAENIRLGRPDAGADDVRAAARRAEVLAFTDQLPEGLDTRLGERGLGLSGGEAQRVALARLFLRSPALLILDEPTAYLDPATEQAVLDALFAFAEGRSLIIASHAAALLARPCRQLRLENGRLIERADAGSGR